MIVPELQSLIDTPVMGTRIMSEEVAVHESKVHDVRFIEKSGPPFPSVAKTRNFVSHPKAEQL